MTKIELHGDDSGFIVIKRTKRRFLRDKIRYFSGPYMFNWTRYKEHAYKHKTLSEALSTMKQARNELISL